MNWIWKVKLLANKLQQRDSSKFIPPVNSWRLDEYASLIPTISCFVLLLPTGHIAFAARPSIVSLSPLHMLESL